MAALLKSVSLYEPSLCALPFGCVDEHRTLINVKSRLILQTDGKFMYPMKWVCSISLNRECVSLFNPPSANSKFAWSGPPDLGLNTVLADTAVIRASLSSTLGSVLWMLLFYQRYKVFNLLKINKYKVPHNVRMTPFVLFWSDNLCQKCLPSFKCPSVELYLGIKSFTQ